MDPSIVTKKEIICSEIFNLSLSANDFAGLVRLTCIMPLKRHPALIPLSHDHRRGLFVANLIRTGAPRYPRYPVDLPAKRAYLLQYYHSDLLPHLHKEETILFPRVQVLSEGIADLVQALRIEHQDLRQAISHLPAAETPELQGAFDALSGLLNAHIRKEERQLFEAIQALLSEESMHQLGEALKEADRDLKNPPQ
jgi:hemerythrin superfamily protein